MIWWEKTVEYYFVKKYLTDSAIAPLDGNEELAGDAIFGRNGKLILIEFKRDSSSIKNEKNKFLDYSSAQAALRTQDQHHFIVFGRYVIDFEISAQTYFSENDISIEKALKNGAEPEAFNAYLECLLGFKKKAGNAGSSGGVSPSNYEVVAMVNDDGEITSCMQLSEYLEHSPSFGLEYTKDNEPRPYNGPSM